MGFGLFGWLVALPFPDGRPAVHALPLVALLAIVLLGMLIVFLLSQGSPGQSSWVPYLFMPVTSLIIVNTLLQRLSTTQQNRKWRWIGLGLGTLPFLVVTILLGVVTVLTRHS